jgi:molybdopterin molybdotransferase
MMITVEEALQLVLQNIPPLRSAKQRINTVFNKVLAENVKSPIDSPPFSQSSMDGYAVRYSDLKRTTHFQVQGINMAGVDSGLVLQKGSAIRIFTGAILPPGADTIVIQENTRIQNGMMSIIDTALVNKYAYVRQQGQQIRKNKIALTKGHILTAGTIGFLTALGVNKIKVFSTPRIGILVTGNELQTPGKKLRPAQIYESNSFTLEALLHEMRMDNVTTARVKDEPEKLTLAFKKALRQHDVVIITGGVSVGDYDYVAGALGQLKVKKIFHAITQKPGKPMYFGMYKDKLIFALPGNPASVMVCFYEYIYPALRKMTGHQDILLPVREMICTNDYAKKSGLSHFLKGLASGEQVTILDGQESFVLSSFAMANCLVVLPASSTGVKAGGTVTVHMINGG